MNTSSPPKALVLSALIGVQVLFGVNYVISKVVVDAFPPLAWASFRLVIATITMVAIALLSGRKHPKVGKNFFIPLIGFSLLGMIINQASFLVGLHYTKATNSAVLNTTIPAFTLLIVSLRGQEPLTLKRAFGFLMAFSGVLVIRRVEELNLSNQTLIGDLLTLLNCLSYSFFLSYSRKFLQENDRIWTTAWLFIYGTLGMGVLALPDWAHFHWPAMNTTLVACMIFAIFGGTLLTYFLNFWALAYTKSSSVALFIYLQPVVASLLAWTWFGEQITMRTLASIGLVFLGVLVALSPDHTAVKAPA